MIKEAYPKLYLYRRIVQAKIFIDEHYDQKLDLDNIADEAYFSKFHFIRLFKKAYNQTPHHYLTSVRIQRAKELLRSACSVIDVCYAVGFESVSSFTALFKRTTGLTPSAFQLQQQLLRLEISRMPLKFIPGCFANPKNRKSNFEEASSSANHHLCDIT